MQPHTYKLGVSHIVLEKDRKQQREAGRNTTATSTTFAAQDQYYSLLKYSGLLYNCLKEPLKAQSELKKKLPKVLPHDSGNKCKHSANADKLPASGKCSIFPAFV